MGKYSLGKSNSSINEQITKDNLFIDEKRCSKLVNSIDKNLELIEQSMLNVESLLNKSLSMGVVTSSRNKVFKSWSRKCKSQANSANNLREKVTNSYEEDVRYYPIKLLEDKITALEDKVAQLEKNEKR